MFKHSLAPAAQVDALYWFKEGVVVQLQGGELAHERDLEGEAQQQVLLQVEGLEILQVEDLLGDLLQEIVGEVQPPQLG